MADRMLNLLGMMRRANAVQIGEVNTGAAVRAGKAKLLLLARDASENALHRAEGFAYGRNVLMVPMPYSKEELSLSLGINGCSMLAVTDIGFANALMKGLAEQLPDSYTALAEETEQRFQKAERRKKEAQAHQRNVKSGKRRTNA